MSATTTGPTALRERALGPDLARGFMLLFIALANTHYFLQASSVLGGFPMGGSTLDSVVTWAIATFVDGRAFPMFGLLFGYGVAHIVARQTGTVWQTRFLLWRRALVLVVLGTLDAVLLYVGDILAAYGVLLFVGAFAIRWKDRWLLIVAALFFTLTALPSDGSMTISTDPPDPSMLPLDVFGQLGDRIVVAPFIALLGPIGFACPFLVGLWAGRRRILEEPTRHRTLLVWTAVIGISAAVLGAQPVALMLAGVVDRPGGDVLSMIGPLHDATGVLGGFGYAALIALIAVRLGSGSGSGSGSGGVTRAIAATGQRSLTCYLAQSLVWAIVFTPYLLDLSDDLSVTSTALLAAATWVSTVVLSDWMRRTGRRGPFEVLIRLVTYGRNMVALGRARA